MRKFHFLPLFALIAATAAITGCGTVSSTAPNALVLSGNVHGGQQPIVGTSVRLWAAGTTTNAAPSPTALSVPVLSGIDGSFSITGLYSCPSPDAQVYLTGKGGDAGGGGNNPSISLISALGNCGDLTPSTYIELNEETTVVAVNVLGFYMDINGNIGTTNIGFTVPQMAAGFSAATLYVNPATGQVPGPNLPTNYTVDAALINTMADIIAACVNSDVTISGSSTLCTEIFNDSALGEGVQLQDGQNVAADFVPSDTVQLTVINSQGYIQNEQSSQAEFALIPSEPPFIPTLQSAHITTWGFLPPGVEMITATTSDDGIVHIANGSGAFAVAATTGSIPSESIVVTTSTGATVPVTVTLCQTNPNNGQCLTAPGTSVDLSVTPQEALTFSVFVQATTTITNNPLLYVTMSDSNGNLLNSTSVILTTN